MKHFIDGDRIAFDTETTGLNLWQGDMPFAFSFANENLDTKYFELPVDPFTRRVDTSKRWVQCSLEKIQRLLEDPRITKVMHNGQFDRRAVELGYGIKMAGPMPDTMHMIHNCNSLEPSLGLKPVCKKLGIMGDEDQKDLQKVVIRMRNWAKKLDWKVGRTYVQRPAIVKGEYTIIQRFEAATASDYWMPRRMAKLHPELFAKDSALLEFCLKACRIYAVKDAIRTLMLDAFFKGKMEELGTTEINQLEQELDPVIYKMVTRGVSTDRVKLQAQMVESAKIMGDMLPHLQKRAWPGFWPKNDEQVRKLFYEKLGFAVGKMTPGGKRNEPKPAVDKFVILAHIDNPIVRDIAIWKANYTAYTTFYSKFDRLSVPDTYGGKTALHCEYRQIGAATGRLSSANPNLQNVMTPENTMAVHPLHVRPAFIVRPGHAWLCTDYEGMEIRMFAAVSDEPTMMAAIHAGRSIHDEMTNTIWGGKDNEEALKQAIRALSLDGTGMHTSQEVDTLWREWGVTDWNVHKMSEKRKYEIADMWLAMHNYDQVRAQGSIGRKNSKTTIKSLSFLKIYGGGAAKAALLLKTSFMEAARVLKLYNEKFPRIDEYSKELIARGRRDGFITSIWGRRLEIEHNYAYRAVNYMIQGSSADLMKSALIRIDKWLTSEQLEAWLLLTIHDEIIIEAKHHELTVPFVKHVQAIMADTEGRLKIPMTTESKLVTHNWSEKHKIHARTLEATAA